MRNDFTSNYLAHHGIKGQKWGIRRYQNPDGTLTAEGKKHYGVSDSYDGRIIKKGSKIYRIANNEADKTYDNKKYVSLNKSDHKEWQKYIGDSYKKRGVQTYNVMYSTTRDLKIAKAEKLGELFTKDYLENSGMADKIISDTQEAARKLGYDHKGDMDDALSLNLAMQTETGKRFVTQLLEMGYDGIEDKHGQNTSKDPVIIFNPDNNLYKKKTNKYK